VEKILYVCWKRPVVEIWIIFKWIFALFRIFSVVGVAAAGRGPFFIFCSSLDDVFLDLLIHFFHFLRDLDFFICRLPLNTEIFDMISGDNFFQ
jgi:hypothetical protein